MSRLIVHIAEVEIAKTGGMSRIAYHWKEAFERHGFEFVHIGLKEAGPCLHRTLFPQAAYAAYRRLNRRADVFIVHEPAAGAFVGSDVPTFVFSHGIERRCAQFRIPPDGTSTKWKRVRQAMTKPLWNLRRRSSDAGFRKSTAVLLCNDEDRSFSMDHYGVPSDRIFLFANGVNTVSSSGRVGSGQTLQALFLGSWINRKGIVALSESASLLYNRGLTLRWLLAGTGVDTDQVLAAWPPELGAVTTVVPRFLEAEEQSLFESSDIFVLPSLFEGQPLALLQAMASGLCCIASNCCGQRDLIQSGQNGLLHETGSADSLATQLERCITDAELRIQLGRNASASVRDRTWTSVSDDVVRFVDSMS